MKFVVLLLFMALPAVAFATNKGRAVVSIGEVEATVRVEGAAAQLLFESLNVSLKTQGLTAIKATSEVACFQYNETVEPSYTCAIFIFVNKDFISNESRYL